MDGRLIGPKTWDRIVGIYGTRLYSLGAVLGGCVIIYAINYGFGVFRPEVAMDFGSTRWNRCLVSGLPMYSPLFGFGTVKNSPGLH